MVTELLFHVVHCYIHHRDVASLNQQFGLTYKMSNQGSLRLQSSNGFTLSKKQNRKYSIPGRVNSSSIAESPHIKIVSIFYEQDV